MKRGLGVMEDGRGIPAKTLPSFKEGPGVFQITPLF
jgi:hypothetical protein